MKTLVIVESPSKQASIQKILGKDYEVLPTYGHISDLPVNRLGVDVGKNFSPTYVLMKDKVEVLQNIINALEGCDRIALSTDPDTEGESISFNLAKYLKPYGKPMERVIFMEITKSGIKKGFAQPREIDLNIVGAARSRRIVDRLAGYLTSPFLSDHYKTNLSAGRVQSAAVKIIVDLEKKIEAFKKEEYWVISADFSDAGGRTFTAKYVPKIRNKDEADKAVSSIYAEEAFKVSNVKAADRPKPAPPPLITVKLQQMMAKEYGFDADRTMKAAQGLYETGHITYLRTDSVRVSDEAQKEAITWLKEKGFPVPKKLNQHSDSDSAQSGHECLRPTNLETSVTSPMLGGDERIVYRAIYEQFLASQMTPAIYSTLQISLSGNKDENLKFKVSGKALKTPGYLAIYGEQKLEELQLPLLTKEDEVKVAEKSIKAEQKFTQPPSRYTVASILDELESKGIGRPATYAGILKTITARNYVEMDGSSFKATKLGRDITELLEKHFSFVDHSYTSKMETLLDQIAGGKMDALVMLQNFYADFKKQLDSAYSADGHDICSQCGGYLLRRRAKNGSEFFGCTGYPKCKTTKTITEVNNENQQNPGSP